jgi:diadenosine tetraphosphate (Ap4A) HIT family hydrolase
MVFTEHGALMAASVLNTDLAVKTSVFIVKAFVELRERAAVHTDLIQKLNELEFIVGLHDEKIRSLFKTIRKLTRMAKKISRAIGFEPKQQEGN